jgi:hypothetical protein
MIVGPARRAVLLGAGDLQLWEDRLLVFGASGRPKWDATGEMLEQDL